MAADARRLRACLGHFATGVAVVTCEGDGAPHGATVNAFTAVSLDPPLVLVSLHRDSKAGRHLKGRPFTVNVLREGQDGLALHFAGRAAAAVPRWVRPAAGLAPRLPDTLATIACSPWAEYDGGDHALFVGRVEEFDHRGDGRPLLFYRGGFQRLPAETKTETKTEIETETETETGDSGQWTVRKRDMAQDWREPWRQAAGEPYTAGLADEIRLAAECGPHGPAETLTLACTVTEAARALDPLLRQEWALYTPQQAAAVASALFAQLEAGAAALRELGGAVRRMADRGDAVISTGVDDRLHTASREIEAHVAQHAATVVATLRAARPRLPLPTDPHDTLARVADLLGAGATLVDHHPVDGPGPGCRCEIRLTRRGEEWSFHREHAAWSLLRLGGGAPAAPVELDLYDEAAHPAHLVDLIRRALSS
ncbi:flavin reductase family protein [Streptomyces sp. NPDC002537]